MLVETPNAHTLLNTLIGEALRGRRVAIYEAGGGSQTVLDPAMLAIDSVTTVDISAEQLARNRYADVLIEADLEQYRPDRTYDLVVVYNVLEHLARADLALENLAAACAPGGLVVVGSPYMRAFSGMVTRATPHGFHVFVYRHLFGRAEAGQPGHPPFRTHYHPLTLPSRLRAFFEARGFECLYLCLHEGEVYRMLRARRPLVGWPLTLLTGLINALTPKAYDTRRGEFHAVFRRPDPAASARRDQADAEDALAGIGDDGAGRVGGGELAPEPVHVDRRVEPVLQDVVERD